MPLGAVKVELTEPTLKCDQTMDDMDWSVHSQTMYSDHDDLSSHNSFGNCISHRKMFTSVTGIN